MTEEEYLRMEESADTKHEFRDGQIIDMAGGTWPHAVIANNIGGEFRNRLKGKPCQPLGSDLRVRIPDKGHYCYPDATVVCGPPVFDPPNNTTTISNPQVVVEVTSPSSERDDYFAKFDDYRRVESIAEYVVISQDKPEVRTFYRHSTGIWAFGPTYTRMDQFVVFPSLGIQIPMTEVYAGVKFDAVVSN